MFYTLWRRDLHSSMFLLNTPLQFRFFNFGAFGLELNLFFKVIKGNLEQHSRRRNAWETFWERFENIYILNVFFRKFCFSYILDLVKTVWALRILSQKFTRKFVIKELWALENHVLVNMLLCSSHFTLGTLRYIKCSLVNTSKLSAYLILVRLI